eukprot:5352301-Pleurochrysis_carterae.AAC.3
MSSSCIGETDSVSAACWSPSGEIPETKSSTRRPEKSSDEVIWPLRDELKAWKAWRDDKPSCCSRLATAASSARCSKSTNSSGSLRTAATAVLDHETCLLRLHARTSLKKACRLAGELSCRQRSSKCCARGVNSVELERKARHSATTSHS